MEKTKQAQPGAINIEEILAKVQIPPKFKDIYEKVVMSGMRIMFDKRSHPMMEQQLRKPSPMAKNISDGIVGLMYLLWTQSNGTLPKEIIIPVTFTLTLRAFDFLQESKDPQATPDVLGQAVDTSLTTIMQKFGVQPAQIQQVLSQQKGLLAQSAPTTGAPQ